METKQDVLERIRGQEKPKCPHCGIEMTLWEVPDIVCGDGLGWGEPFLYICFNEECPIYTGGWEELMENYGHKSSCRCMNFPGTDKYEFLPVFGPEGGQGQVINDETIAEKEAQKEAIKTGFSILADCYVNQDVFQILKMLLDATEPTRVRLKAAEMMGDIGDTEAIDPLRNTKFGNKKVGDAVLETIKKIHEKYFTRECPFCAEIIKQQAKICKHCKEEVAGK